jgi:predicted ATPase
VLVRMSQGKKDLTGPSGRERVVRLIAALRDEGVLASQQEANALLLAAGMAPLFEGQPAELALLKALPADRDSATAAPPASTPAPAPESRLTNLPAPLTSFVGREREVAEVGRLLTTTRLLTLTGAGGCGKTRLALEVGAALPRLAFPDGVWLVDLAPLTEPALVAGAVLAVLDLRAASRPAPAVLAEHLHDKHTLLLLDNCEHLIGACAELAEALLRACPGLHILATSRERLNVPGEVTWRVPSLAPEEGAQLFAARARAAQPDFAVTPANAESVARICRQLDNMPLALELAATRVYAFTVEQVAARLDDAFGLLTGGSRTALPRQQTLRATIDWSYSLLTDPERTLLRELSVFAGGWTLEAAEALHGAGTPGLLEQLVTKSLVIVEAHPAGPRYRMLETIRQYAYEKLVSAGEEERARRLHLAYYTGLSQAAQPHLYGGAEGRAWGERLSAELDNARAALGWAAQRGNWQAVLDGDILLIDYLALHGYADEARQWVDAAILSNPRASDTARVWGYLDVGEMVMIRGDMVGSADWLRRASALAHQEGDEYLILWADTELGWVTPDYAEARALLSQVMWRGGAVTHLSQQPDAMGDREDPTQLLALCVEAIGRTGDTPQRSPGWWGLLAAMHLGERLSLHGDYEQAADLLTRCVAAARAVGGSGGVPSSMFRRLGRGAGRAVAYPLYRLGQVYLACGDYPRARAALQESVALNRASGVNRSEVPVELGTVGVYTGDYSLARQALREGLPHFYMRDNLERVAQTLVLAAGLAQTLGKLPEAARLLGAAAATRRDHHTHGVFERELFAEYDRRLPTVQAAMDPADFERAWAEGQQLTIQEAIAEALAI